MVFDNNLLIKRHKEKKYLVYLLTPCEMGSEGWSGWMYYAVAHGNTDKDIYEDWIEQCKHIYGVDLSEDLRCINATDEYGNATEQWMCYYPLCKVELQTSVYGDAQEIKIDFVRRKHDE